MYFYAHDCTTVKFSEKKSFLFGPTKLQICIYSDKIGNQITKSWSLRNDKFLSAESMFTTKLGLSQFD